MGNSTTNTTASVFQGSVVAAAFLAVLITLSLTLNVFICVAIVRFKKLHSVTSVFIFNLCIADILITIFSMTVWLAYQVHGYPFFINLTSNYEEVFHCWQMMDTICEALSILSLTAISVVKYVAISRPLTYKSITNRKTNAVVIILIWVYALSVSNAWHFKREGK